MASGSTHWSTPNSRSSASKSPNAKTQSTGQPTAAVITCSDRYGANQTPDSPDWCRPHMPMDSVCDHRSTPIVLLITKFKGLPRLSVAGKPLPNARLVSLNAATDSNINDKKFTLFVMQWGQVCNGHVLEETALLNVNLQFIDHDLTLASNTRATTGEGLICCAQEARSGITRIDHPSCLPIPIAADDPFYSKHGQRCMNFVRNLPVPRANCALGMS